MGVLARARLHGPPWAHLGHGWWVVGGAQVPGGLDWTEGRTVGVAELGSPCAGRGAEVHCQALLLPSPWASSLQ